MFKKEFVKEYLISILNYEEEIKKVKEIKKEFADDNCITKREISEAIKKIKQELDTDILESIKQGVQNA